MTRYLALAVVVSLCAACSKQGEEEAKPTPPKGRAKADAAPVAKNKPTSGVKHGLRYWLFDRSGQALAKALESKPRVVGFGEYHEKAGGPNVAPPMKRFTDGMLDVIASNTSDLVFETWVQDGRCGAKQVRVDKTVKKQLKRPAHQMSTMMTLINRARKLHIQPHRLVFSCKEYSGLLNKKTKRVEYRKLLLLITKKLGEVTAKIIKHRDKLAATKHKPQRRMIAIYGGAFHNEKYPYDHYRVISYVKAVEKAAGSYVEVDIFVPEIIKGNERLSKEKFYPLFEELVSDKKVVLIERGKYSFIMVMRRGLKLR